MMMKLIYGNKLVCPHCQFEFDDVCEDFLLQGINKQVGRVETIECDNCYGNIDMCDNGDGTISVDTDNGGL